MIDAEKLKKWWPVVLILLVGSVVGAIVKIVGGVEQLSNWIDPPEPAPVEPIVVVDANAPKINRCGGTIYSNELLHKDFNDLKSGGDWQFANRRPIAGDHWGQSGDEVTSEEDYEQLIDCFDRNLRKVIWLGLDVDFSSFFLLDDKANYDPEVHYDGRIVECPGYGEDALGENYNEVAKAVFGDDQAQYVIWFPRTRCTAGLYILGGDSEVTYNGGPGTALQTWRGFYTVKRILPFQDWRLVFYVMDEADVPFEIRQNF